MTLKYPGGQSGIDIFQRVCHMIAILKTGLVVLKHSFQTKRVIENPIHTKYPKPLQKTQTQVGARPGGTCL